MKTPAQKLAAHSLKLEAALSRVRELEEGRAAELKQRRPVPGEPDAAVKCDYGDACPGHASPDDRPCDYDPGNYHEPQPQPADPRPTCIKCGKRWVPNEGVDATVVPCPKCQPQHAIAECPERCEPQPQPDEPMELCGECGGKGYFDCEWECRCSACNGTGRKPQPAAEVSGEPIRGEAAQLRVLAEDYVAEIHELRAKLQRSYVLNDEAVRQALEARADRDRLARELADERKRREVELLASNERLAQIVQIRKDNERKRLDAQESEWRETVIAERERSDAALARIRELEAAQDAERKRREEADMSWHEAEDVWRRRAEAADALAKALAASRGEWIARVEKLAVAETLERDHDAALTRIRELEADVKHQRKRRKAEAERYAEWLESLTSTSERLKREYEAERDAAKNRAEAAERNLADAREKLASCRAQSRSLLQKQWLKT